MEDLYLSKVNPEQNEYRMYRLCLPKQSCELLQQWGRIGEYSYEKWDSFETHELAKKQFDKLEKAKRAEGYITANRGVMPRNHLFYEAKGSVESGGQLSLFDEI